MKGHGKSSRSKTADDADLIWGINPVREALIHNRRGVSEILVQKGRGGTKLQEIVDLARENQIRLRFVEAARLKIPGKGNHQGVVARQTRAPLYTLHELLHPSDIAKPQKLLALDSIQDPQNLGAILRSAAASGFNSVLLTREHSAPLSGTVAKVAAGALVRLRIASVTNLVSALQKVKEAGFWVYGSVADPSADPIYSVSLRPPICLVIGSEGKGIRPLVQKSCDQRITIPMHGGFDSINASVAAGIIMFEIVRQESLKLSGERQGNPPAAWSDK